MIRTKTVKALRIAPSLRTELSFLEVLNPCDQVYWQEGDHYIIEYKQKMDVFNFIRGLSLAIKFSIVGMPYSVSKKGYGGSGQGVVALLNKTRGLKIILNGDDDLDLPKALTLPSYVFTNTYTSFEHYLKSMRSHYRYRTKKALDKGKNLVVKKIQPCDFNKEHYNLYLQVYENSNDKLECLSLEFFRTLPSEIYIFSESSQSQALGFVQLQTLDQELRFLFGGFSRAHNIKYDLYMNMLLKIIQLGIEKKSTHIEFGQTAEETKAKLGCLPQKKYLYVYHHNKWVQKTIGKILPLLSYKEDKISYRVFKD